METSRATRSTEINVLVLFTDHIFHICKPGDVSAFRKKCPAVKFADGKKYTARVLALHEDRAVLEKLQRSLEEEETSVFFKDLEITGETFMYKNVVKKHEQHRDSSKLYLDSALVSSWGTNSNENAFSLSEQEDKNFFQIQNDFVESKFTRLDAQSNSNFESGNDHETAVHEDDRAEHSEDVFDANNEKISIKLRPTSPTPHEKMSIEHDSSCQIPDEKGSPKRAHWSANQVQNETKIHSSAENNTSKREVEMHNIVARNVGKRVEGNPVNDDSHIDENCNCSVLSNLNENAGRMSTDQSRNENLSVDGNCNVAVISNANEDIPTTVNDAIIEEKVQEEFQKILSGIGMTKSISENLYADPHENSIFDHIFKSNWQSKVNVEELLEDGSDNIPACDGTLNSKVILDPPAFEVLGCPKTANNCENGLLTIDEHRSKPTIVSNVLLTEDLRKSINNSLLDNMPKPVLSSTFLETTDKDFTGPDSEEIESRVDDNGAESVDESSSEEYVPSALDSSSSVGENDEGEKAEKSINRKKRQNVSNSSVNITLGRNKQGASAPDDTELKVASSKTATHTKKNFCLYCQKLQSKLARHLELLHANEEDVKKFTALPPKNVERMHIIAKIRKSGNHLYNTDRRFNRGELLVVRRPQERMKKCAKDFVPCGNCYGQYSRAVIRHHFRRCTKKSGHKERLVMVKSRKVSARIHEKANDLVRTHVFPYMREDDIVRRIRYDKLIILYANKQCEKYGLHQHHYQMIRGRLRLLGRFLMAITERNNAIKELSDVFQPRHYDNSVEAVKIVAGFNEISRVFAHPAVASNLGTLLKSTGQIQRSEYIKDERAHDQKRVEDFLKLQSEDYGTSVNRAVLETQLQNNRRKKVVLPNLEDITKLHNFLNAERQIHFERLNTAFSVDAWRKLAEVTLISLQLFNRRRAGEIERVYIEDFYSYQGIDQVADKEIYATLSKHGQALARKYVRFMIRGKLGRGVPVLIPSNILDCLVLICKYRENAGVPEANPYLFGLPSKDRDRVKYLRACELLRQFAEQCGADVPNTLRGTQLRKHVATKCVALNLSENEVSNLANFLGHADKIHKQIYRQPDVQNDIVKISQLLEMAQGTVDFSDDNSSSEEEPNPISAGPIEAENLSCSEDEGTSNTLDRSKQGKKAFDSRKSIPAERRGHTHRRWTEMERSTVLHAFKTIMRGGNMPTGDQIQKVINANACLKGREVAQVRTWLHTQKKKIRIE